LFAEQLRRQVPLAAHIRRVLDERPGHRAPRIRFETELEDQLSEEDAAETLQTVISWGRFGELFSYDDQAEVFSLDNPT
jgi:NitT/TauT family transport system ATP-binding protein